MADAVLSSKFRQYPMLMKMLTSLGIHGLGGFHEVDILQHPKINQFVSDTKEIQKIVKSGLIDPKLRSNLEFALDIALAQQNFIKS